MTDENIIKIVEEVLIDFNLDIVTSLKKNGSDAISIHSKENNIINIKPEKKDLGFVGIPDKININFIDEALNKNKIPIVAPLGLGKNNQTYNINGLTQ